jgi:anti-sigma regulatory factor (Ser/Thr protein kinase)
MKDNGMLERLFFKLLPVQILIVAMGSVNLIVDGAAADILGAGNVVDHGFTKDEKDHMAEAHVVYKDGNIMLRIKDDCIPFDPMERAAMFDPDDPFRNMGLKMVIDLAKEITYQNMMGLNVLTIRL